MRHFDQAAEEASEAEEDEQVQNMELLELCVNGELLTGVASSSPSDAFRPGEIRGRFPERRPTPGLGRLKELVGAVLRGGRR